MDLPVWISASAAFFRAYLARPTATGLCRVIALAMPIASSISLSSGTTLFTKLIARASPAGMSLPVRTSSLAFPIPAASGAPCRRLRG